MQGHQRTGHKGITQASLPAEWRVPVTLELVKQAPTYFLRTDSKSRFTGSKQKHFLRFLILRYLVSLGSIMGIIHQEYKNTIYSPTVSTDFNFTTSSTIDPFQQSYSIGNKI